MKNSEEIINAVLELLKDKHYEYKPERFNYYIVKGENEAETDSGDFCENCIGAAVKKTERNYYKERAKKLSQIRDLEKKGYCFTWGYNTELNNKYLIFNTATKTALSRHKKYIKENYPANIPFSYRYYQRDSDTTFRNCDTCGNIIEVCVTADEQEIEHWESMEDAIFLLAEMDVYTGYQIYEIMQFIHQCEPDIEERGMILAKKILKLNKIEL